MPSGTWPPSGQELVFAPEAGKRRRGRHGEIPRVARNDQSASYPCLNRSHERRSGTLRSPSLKKVGLLTLIVIANEPSFCLISEMPLLVYVHSVLFEFHGEFAGAGHTLSLQLLLIASLDGLVCRHVSFGDTGFAHLALDQSEIALLEVGVQISDGTLPTASSVQTPHNSTFALFVSVFC